MTTRLEPPHIHIHTEMQSVLVGWYFFFKKWNHHVACMEDKTAQAVAEGTP